ncbi:anti-sigma regulatory factor (Ser/Thr protein kinase) [Frankia casuarinae]|jgi:anti-sigma regulatory factor (Ser/Thr protein kinase)|uniref:Serine/threonine kinaseanti-sigma factor n=1 Tax=Frankia casuarinae (strain DSM 45818 / CECT 9043 / HFP020203 / CcI3) TaxID=106370 RepID=Q2JAE6_FRACC|nr:MULTISPECIES: ATP-binding protein [Frankia]ABD11746.1 putative serine/threonine kinaseanti-sigma factor [Frankia casuarinae]EYT93194.1 anti-sigma regulatory factor (Ser/Thr protein kinase) [Frankia casuarinae]OHV56263.1 hypothetical protein CgIS1_09090 [Frankia sp. CgIS1]TFE32843.1 ATP-binding protein [Frankia sp. B2]
MTGTQRLRPAVYVEVYRAPATAASVGDIRRHVVELVQQRGAEDCAYTAELIVSELATNAVKASETARQPMIAVRTSFIGRLLTVEVWDGSPALPEARPTDLDSEGGLGLLLVDELAQRWSYYLTKLGKVVWAEIPLPEPVAVDNLSGPKQTDLPRRELLTGLRTRLSDFSADFVTDMATLRRVVDRLRALDDWTTGE